eukprot:1063419-Rhodomonas_salina.1
MPLLRHTRAGTWHRTITGRQEALIGMLLVMPLLRHTSAGTWHSTITGRQEALIGMPCSFTGLTGCAIPSSTIPPYPSSVPHIA